MLITSKNKVNARSSGLPVGRINHMASVLHIMNTILNVFAASNHKKSSFADTDETLNFVPVNHNEMDISLQGKHALIGGGSQGIGLAIAQELAQLGASCMLVARHEDHLQQAVAQLDITKGQQHGYLVADFQDTESTCKKIKSLVEKKTIHILINNSGGPPPGDITDATAVEFVTAFEQHVVAYQLITQAVLPRMKAVGYGRIINVVSTSVRIPIVGLGVSNTIRGAVASWAKTWSNEVAQYGITVNNILPGATETSRLSDLIEKRATAAETTAERIIKQMTDEIPAKRFGKPAEIAAMAAFLASPAAAYINGTSIPVDGGKTGTI